MPKKPDYIQKPLTLLSNEYNEMIKQVKARHATERDEAKIIRDEEFESTVRELKARHAREREEAKRIRDKELLDIPSELKARHAKEREEAREAKEQELLNLQQQHDEQLSNLAHELENKELIEHDISLLADFTALYNYVYVPNLDVQLDNIYKDYTKWCQSNAFVKMDKLNLLKAIPESTNDMRIRFKPCNRVSGVSNTILNLAKIQMNSEYTYAQFVEQGWTIEQLIEVGHAQLANNGNVHLYNIRK